MSTIPGARGTTIFGARGLTFHGARGLTFHGARCTTFLHRHGPARPGHQRHHDELSDGLVHPGPDDAVSHSNGSEY
jgi:hypothetical protein